MIEASKRDSLVGGISVAWWLVALGLLFGGARVVVAVWWPSALGLLQALIFVLVSLSLLIWGLRAKRWWLPRWIVVGALICMLVSALGGYSLLRTRGDTGEGGVPLFITRLEGDPNGASARVLREAIDEGATVLGVKERVARQVYRGVSGGAELSELFDRLNGEAALVWGSQQLVRYSPVPKPGRTLQSFLEDASSAPPDVSLKGSSATRILSGRLEEMQLVMDVSTVALSFDPARATGEFLAALGSAAELQARTLQDGSDTQSRRTYQLLLEGAARMPFKWRSIEHKAYPFFLLGTDLLIEFLRGGMVQVGLLECAMRDFRSARVNLVRGGNPELLAAVRNNAAIASALLREFNGEPWSVSLREELGAAMQLAKRPDPFGVGSRKVVRIVGANLAVIKGSGRRADRNVGTQKRGKEENRAEPREREGRGDPHDKE